MRRHAGDFSNRREEKEREEKMRRFTFCTARQTSPQKRRDERDREKRKNRGFNLIDNKQPARGKRVMEQVALFFKIKLKQ